MVKLKKILLLFLSIYIVLTPLIGTTTDDRFKILLTIRAYSIYAFISCVGIYFLFKSKLSTSDGYQIIIYLMSIAIWSAIGIYNGYSAYPEARALVLLFFTFFAILMAYKENLVYINTIKKVSYILMIIWCGSYLMITLGLLTGVVPTNLLIAILELYKVELLNTGFLGMFPRVGAGVNIVPLIIYGFYMCEHKGGNIYIWLLTLFFVLIDFGRIDMAFFAVLTMFFIYYKFMDFKSGSKFISRFIICLFFVLMIGSINNIFGVDISEFWGGTTERFEQQSDPRTLQIKYIEEYIGDSVFYGRGLGAYVHEYVRNDAKWVYEMQFHAFFMQMGIAGGVLIIVNYLVFFGRNLCKEIDICRLYMAIVCVAFWLIDSAFQGGLYQECGGVVCVLVYLFTRENKKSFRR